MLLLTLLFWGLSGGNGWANQASVRLSIEPEQIRVGDEVTLKVEASGEFDSIDPPKSPFQLQNAGQSTSMSIINGRTTTRVTFHYVLRPDKVGTFSLGPAIARARNTAVARSNAVQLKVRKAVTLAPLAPGKQKIESYEGKAAFILTQVAKGEVLVGEALRVNIDLYIRRGYPATGYDFIRGPGFEGFKKESLFTGREDRRRMQKDIRVGRTEYIVMPIERAVLIPLSEGKRVVGDLEIKLEVQSGFRRSTKRVLAQPVEILVQSLDNPRAPSSYVPGVVGRFKLAGGPDKTQAKVGERILLDLTVSGEGNIDAIEAPVVPLVDGVRVEAIPGRDCPDREITEKGYRGRCRFQSILYPEKAGAFLFGPVTFDYLDPDSRRYKSMKLGPWTFKIHPSDQASGFQGRLVDRPVPETKLEPAFMDRMPSGGRKNPLPVPPSPWAALGGPVALMALLSLWGRFSDKRANDPRLAVKRIISHAQKDLRATSTADVVAVSEVVTSSVRRTLIALIATDPQGLAMDGLRRALESHGIPPGLSTEILDVWEQAELFRYGGGSDPEALKARALQLIVDLSKEPK